MLEVEIPEQYKYESYYTLKERTKIKRNLKSIILKYDKEIVAQDSLRSLNDCRNGLLKVMLNNLVFIQRCYEIRTGGFSVYRSWNDMSELYKYLKIYKKKFENKGKDISTTTSLNLKLNYLGGFELKIKDRKVTDWIVNQLLEEFEQMRIPSTFGLMRFMARAEDNEEVSKQFKETSEQKILPRWEAIYLYCQSIVNYLNDNVKLITSAEYLPSNIIKFLIEILIIMNVSVSDEEKFGLRDEHLTSAQVNKVRANLRRYNTKYLKNKRNPDKTTA